MNRLSFFERSTSSSMFLWDRLACWIHLSSFVRRNHTRPSDLLVYNLQHLFPLPSSWVTRIRPPSISSFKVQLTSSHGSLMKESSTFSTHIFSPTPHSRRRVPHKRLTNSSRSIAQERKIERTKDRKVFFSRCGESSSL